VFFQHQAELRLGSNFVSLIEPSHEPARFGSIPPLADVTLYKLPPVDALVRPHRAARAEMNWRAQTGVKFCEHYFAKRKIVNTESNVLSKHR
jgi:hypothetical protein